MNRTVEAGYRVVEMEFQSGQGLDVGGTSHDNDKLIVHFAFFAEWLILQKKMHACSFY